MSPAVAIERAVRIAPARSLQSYTPAGGLLEAADIFAKIDGPFSPTQRTAFARSPRAVHISSSERSFCRPPTIWITLPGGNESSAAIAASGMVAIESL